MFDIGWSEMALIAVVAIVVIGPKDLPKVLRSVGQFTAKARSMAREFQNSMDELAREAEVDELKRDVGRMAQFDIKDELEKTIDPGGEIRQSLNEVDDKVRALEHGEDAAAQPSSPPPLGPVDADSADPPKPAAPAAAAIAEPAIADDKKSAAGG